MKCENDITSLIDSIYPSISQGDLSGDQYFLDRTILCALNEEMLSVNTAVLEKFPGQEYMFQSANNIHFEKGVDAARVGNLYPPEYLNLINHSGLPLSKLVVKVQCPLMLLRNIDPQKGLCNGTRCALKMYWKFTFQGQMLMKPIELLSYHGSHYMVLRRG